METRCGQPQQSNHQSKPSMTNCGTLSHLIRNATLWVVCFVLLGFLTACGSGNRVQPTGTAAPTAEALATATAPAESQLSATGPVLFITPRPVRAEEPLTGAGRDIPSVFEGVTEYHAIQATVATEPIPPPPATTLAEAAKAVVKIFRCDNTFGCETAVGSGVIIHPGGLVLTAYHVLLRDPDDPTAQRYEEFIIAPTIDTRTVPQAAYRAHMVADKREQDLALLQIDHTVDGKDLSRTMLDLPTLPIADVSDLFGAPLQVLGYPINGGEAISIDRTNFRSFDDGGRLIVVDRALNPGNSGGPALIEQDGRFAVAGIVIRRRSTQSQLSSEGLVRAIDQLMGLSWSPRIERAWSTGTTATVAGTGDAARLQLALSLNALDLADHRLRLLFYATDAKSQQPWQRANAGGPLVLWADIIPQHVLMRRAVILSVPIATLGTTPERLRFQVLLWDWDEQIPLWVDTANLQLPTQVITFADAVTPTHTPLPSSTNVATIAPTATPTYQPTAMTGKTMTLFITGLTDTLYLQSAETMTFTVPPTPTSTNERFIISEGLPYAELTKVTLAAQVGMVASPSHPTSMLLLDPVPAGSAVHLIAADNNAAWLLVEYQNKIGWMPSLFSQMGTGRLEPPLIIKPLDGSCTQYVGATFAPDKTWLNSTSGSVIVTGSIFRPSVQANFDQASLQMEINGSGQIVASDYLHVPLTPSSAIIFFTFFVEEVAQGSEIQFSLDSTDTEDFSFQTNFFDDRCGVDRSSLKNEFLDRLPVGILKPSMME